MIVQYEEEINRWRRLLDITWKPEIKLHRTDIPQQPVCKEKEVLPEQQLWNQERSSSLDQEEPEPPQIKEEQEELCITTETAAEIQPQQISLQVKETAHLQEENQKLKQELPKKKLDKDFLKDNNSKVKFYTGLPYFMLLLTLIRLRLNLPKKKKKKRLNLPLEHVANLFDISWTTTSTVFNITVNVLYAHLSPLVHWPGRHCIQASTPHQFVEMFGDHVTVIIDCFELFIERAQNVRAKTETYSTYKSRHTMTYLTGITPQGTISFISKVWGGCTSNKRIAKTSGFLQKLSPGDIVLADRGFDIKESVALMAKDVEETRKLAHVRIHVERVIGCLRSKYSILNDTISLGLVVPCEGEKMTLLDKIVAVSCALTNMCPRVVLKKSSDE
uniref:DDE Tnp4 domain-containing protein n=1 Tax=Pundamilia nyererei TaxID=303518 RepID=A0A3B4EY00_9CICH